MASPPARRGLAVGFLATLAAGLLVISGISIAIGVAAANTVHSGVTIGGVNLAGLDRACGHRAPAGRAAIAHDRLGRDPDR